MFHLLERVNNQTVEEVKLMSEHMEFLKNLKARCLILWRTQSCQTGFTLEFDLITLRWFSLVPGGKKLSGSL